MFHRVWPRTRRAIAGKKVVVTARDAARVSDLVGLAPDDKAGEIAAAVKATHRGRLRLSRVSFGPAMARLTLAALSRQGHARTPFLDQAPWASF
jgi:hypothetical protein